MSGAWDAWVAVCFRVIDAFNLLVIFFFVGLNGAYTVMSFAALPALTRYFAFTASYDPEDLLTHGACPSVTILAPAFNESATCVGAVKSFLALRYPDLRVIFINDGSKDDTLEKMREAFDLVPRPRAPQTRLSPTEIRATFQSRKDPRLWVIDKANGGRADAINCGLQYARGDLVCLMDSDGILERDGLLRTVLPYLTDRDTVGVGGSIRVVNDCVVTRGVVREVRLPRKLLAKFQVLEYMRSYLCGRAGFDFFGQSFFLSGAWGLYRRDVLVEIGGLAHGSLAEDMDLSLRIHARMRQQGRRYRIGFCPESVVWTEVPDDLRSLVNQRDRWQRGICECMGSFRWLLFNPRYGALAFFGFPVYYLLEMPSPAIEVCGVMAMTSGAITGRISAASVLAFCSLAYAWAVGLSWVAIAYQSVADRRYERASDVVQLLLIALIEPFTYRLITLYARLRGLWKAVRGDTGWGAMTRTGFSGGG